MPVAVGTMDVPFKVSGFVIASRDLNSVIVLGEKVIDDRKKGDNVRNLKIKHISVLVI